MDDDLLAAYDAQLRGWNGRLPDGARLETDGPLVRVVGLHQGFVSGPRDLALPPAELDDLIARQRDYFAARGESVEWKTRSHDLPPDLPDRLRAAGFEPDEPETVLVARTDDIAVSDPVLPPGVELRTVTDPADLHRLAAMQAEVWGEDKSWLADELNALIASGDDTVTVLVAETEGEVVSSCRLVVEPGTDFAGLWGGATLAAWRGRGIYRATVAARARLAAAAGYRYVYVDASPDSAPILRRLGFTAITGTTPYIWTPQPD
ncbi:GNAT family N-acetyltransferase [Streptomyces sp. OF3]|uniref:GNAT family N-acetyltransferase n=1 Tax=Streptomyces alkaliterrae TaxID=2213162 RepID=A0A7W3WR10_9ACTN|nr:GNAT family N-acetyltransferase [Streptomyces alkaliterrae]MBB1256891.1 GNAT family N-acetyltransferase [Streptomyces alkaliterrae]